MYNNNETTSVFSILNELDNIDSVVYESEMNVLSSMNEAYYKTALILENYEGEELDTLELFSNSTYYQEAKSNKTTDENKNNEEEKKDEESFFRRVDKDTGKKENILISILLAIPRIIIKLGEMIAGLFKKKGKSQEDIEKMEKVANNNSQYFFEAIDYLSPDLRKDCQLLVNKEIKKYGVSTKVIFYTSATAGIAVDLWCVVLKIFDIKDSIIGFFKRIKKIYTRISEDFNFKNPDSTISKFLNETKSIINKDKGFDLTTAEYSGKMFLALYDEMRDICKTMSDTTKVTSKTLSIAIKKCEEYDKNADTLKKAKDLSDKCLEINDNILKKTKIIKTVRDYTANCVKLLKLVYPIDYFNEGLLMDNDAFWAKMNEPSIDLATRLHPIITKQFKSVGVDMESLASIKYPPVNVISKHWSALIGEMVLWREANPRKANEGKDAYRARFYKDFIREKNIKSLIDDIKTGFKDHECVTLLTANNRKFDDAYFKSPLYEKFGKRKKVIYDIIMHIVKNADYPEKIKSALIDKFIPDDI